MSVQTLFAQQLFNKPLKAKIEGGFIHGTQLYNDNSIYNPGFYFSATESVELNKYLNLGLGAKYVQLKNERFIPIYLDLINYIKDKQNTFYINGQFGYSIGWNPAIANLKNSDYSGGLCVAAGLGRRFRLADSVSLLLQLKYTHQFALLEYEIYDHKNYAEKLNYDMVSLSIGVLL